jgi:hypothetical protein
MPTVKYQEREYRGMLEYKKEDEPMLIKNLIIGKQQLSMVINGFQIYILLLRSL